jgi:hypothetical protein
MNTQKLVSALEVIEGPAFSKRLHDNAPDLYECLRHCVERMETVAERIPVHNRAKGVSQRTHVAHMAGHLAQHAKKARALLQRIEND